MTCRRWPARRSSGASSSPRRCTGFGALLCLVNTYWSIGFIVLLQLNYAIAPRLGLLARL